MTEKIKVLYSIPGMTEPEPRETFGFALFCQGSVSFARFLPSFARFLPRFCLKMPVFCPVLPSFARFARFVWFCPNSPGFIRFHSSPVCLVLAITAPYSKKQFYTFDNSCDALRAAFCDSRNVLWRGCMIFFVESLHDF